MPKTPFPFPFKCLPRWLDEKKTGWSERNIGPGNKVVSASNRVEEQLSCEISIDRAPASVFLIIRAFFSLFSEALIRERL